MTSGEEFTDTKLLHTDLKKKVLVGASFSVFAQTANYGIQTVGTIVLARLLSPEDFGLVTMVATFSLLIQNFGLNGFTEAVVQSEDINHQIMSKLFWTNLGIMSVFTLGFIALSPLIVWFYKEPQLKNISLAMAFSIFFGGLSTCHLALLNRNMKFKTSSIIQVLAGILSTGIAIITAVKGIGYWALVLRRLALPFLTAAFAWLFCKWRPGRPARETNIKPTLTFGIKTYGNFLLTYLRNNLDRILVGRAFGKASLGHYDRANQLSALLPSQLTIALSGVGVSALSRLRNDPERYLNYFSKALALLSFLGFPGSVALTLLGKDIIILLLGKQWSIAGDIFVALGPAIGLFVIYNTSTWLHISLGRADRLLKWSILVLISSVVAYSIGLMFGPIGVAVAYSILFYILLIPALWYAGRPLHIKASFYLSIIWKYWSAAFLSGGVYWLIFHVLGPTSAFYSHLHLLNRIALGSLLYLILYLVFIGIFFKGLKPLSLLISTIKAVF
jgi:PST family polysaccharide transporter